MNVVSLLRCAICLGTVASYHSYLSAGGLGEPESPLVHERVLNIEVLGVVEDCDLVRRGGDRSDVLVGHGVTILHGGHCG